MAWTTPTLRNAGDAILASDQNIWVNNQLAGGPIYATTAARDAAIPSPFAGQRAYVSGTNINYQHNGTTWLSPSTLQIPPMCIQQRTGQVISDSTLTAFAFSSAASLDTNTMSSTTTNNTRTTATTAGVYQVCGSVDVTAGGTIDVVAYAALRANGTTNFAVTSIASNGYTQQVSLSGIVNLAAAGYVELLVYQDNTANATRTMTGYLQMAYIGRAS